MIARHILRLVPLLLIFLVSSLPAQEQTGDAASETSPTVPALQEFHTVIFKIWHTAWPEKDYALLTTLVPDIDRGVTAIAAARLPGILREKAAAWNMGVSDLQTIAAGYKAAASANENQKLLDAAERLHSQYEKLVRTIRPPLKELESFHSTLYLLYHYYMPQDSLARIAASVEELSARMKALNAAVLPPRLKPKEEAFTRARANLDHALKEVIDVIPSNDRTKIKPAIETMHGSYEALAKVFE